MTSLGWEKRSSRTQEIREITGEKAKRQRAGWIITSVPLPIGKGVPLNDDRQDSLKKEPSIHCERRTLEYLVFLTHRMLLFIVM